MKVLDWLEQQEPGFSDVAMCERRAIMEFSLLWSLFESKVLDTRASVSKIKQAAQRWSEAGLLKEASFAGALAHFRDRYVSDNGFTGRFHNLNFRPRDDRALVERVLQKAHEEDWEEAAAILIIVYRLRNNLFHGDKWAYYMKWQHDNFYYANASLMRAIEFDKMRPEGNS